VADDVKRLLLQIDCATELLRRNLADGDAHLARFESDTKRRMTSIDRSFSGLGRGIDTAVGKFNVMRGALAAIGVAFSIQAIAGFIRSSFELGSALAETAQQLGVSTRALQVYRYVGSQVGIQQEIMDRSLGKLNKTLGEAALGAERPRRALERFGFSLEEIRRGLTVEQVIPRLADGLSRITSSSQRAAVETLLFGRAGQALDTMLAGGSGQINELAAAAESLGIILSDEQIRRLDAAHDKYEKLKTVLSARIAGAVADNAASILDLADALTTLVTTLADATSSWRSFWLGVEANRLERQLAQNNADLGYVTSNAEGLNILRENVVITRQISANRQEQLQIAHRNDPAWRAAHPPPPPRRAPPHRTATPDLTDLEASGSASTTRTPEQAFADFERALAALGIHRNRGRSGHRSFADQADIFAHSPPGDAARPGTSDHERWQALDLPADVDWTKVLEAARVAGITGVRRLVHGTNRHSHVSWSGHGAPGQGGESGGEIEAVRDEAQFASDLRRGHIAALTAARDLSTNYAERADLSKQILDVQRDQEMAELALSVQTGERTKAQAGQLATEYDIADKLNRQAIDLEAQQRQRDAAEQLQTQRAEIARGLLEGEAALATTQAERRRIELLILDQTYAEQRGQLQRIIRDSRDADEVHRATERLASLDAQHDQQRAGTIRDTRGPLEEWQAAVPRTAAEMNQALQNVAAEGLTSLNQGLVDAIMGTKSLGQVFKEVANQIIADLLRIAIQKMILAGLNAVMGGIGGGGGMGNADVTSILNGIPGRAVGGPVSAKRPYIVGERGPEVFQPNVPGTIIPNHALGGAGVSIQITQHIDARGADRDGLNRLAVEMEAQRRALPATIVGVVRDAVGRRIIR
jgi:hypothetical protein